MSVSFKAVSATVAGALVTLLLAMPPPASASDRDCGDFATQRAAQIFFLKHGGPRRDPHRLDGDDDGVACEDNPCPCYRRKRLPRLALDSVDGDFVFSWAYTRKTTKSAQWRSGR